MDQKVWPKKTRRALTRRKGRRGRLKEGASGEIVRAKDRIGPYNAVPTPPLIGRSCKAFYNA